MLTDISLSVTLLLVPVERILAIPEREFRAAFIFPALIPSFSSSVERSSKEIATDSNVSGLSAIDPFSIC